MKKVVLAAATDLLLTGLLLIVSPALFAWLISGAEPSVVGQALGRVAGVAMAGFGLAIWAMPAARLSPTSATRALLIFNLLATISLGLLAIAGRSAGILLWPAVALHLVLTLLLGRVWFAGDSRVK